MLLTLGKKRESDGSVASRLLDCHERIRRFCAMAKRLAAGAPEKEARDAAAELHRYFAIALPLHMADEEESLRPRLERIGGGDVSDAFELMAREHVEADITVAELLQRWQEIIDGPTAARCMATELGAAWLASHMRHHLHAEETRIFPVLAQLPPAQQAAIVDEMRSRRA
jgi:hemerythrin-like domain-containing protein